MSLSAWRAWIEITAFGAERDCHKRVALRMESVDRNFGLLLVVLDLSLSLSAWRAWIEISSITPSNLWADVALRMESVDRNMTG